MFSISKTCTTGIEIVNLHLKFSNTKAKYFETKYIQNFIIFVANG